MITLTITLKSTPHQIVLGYKGDETVDVAVGKIADQARADLSVMIGDDYGQRVFYEAKDVASVVRTDLDAYTDFKINKVAWQSRGEKAAQLYFEQRPDLKEYVGSELSRMFSGDK